MSYVMRQVPPLPAMEEIEAISALARLAYQLWQIDMIEARDKVCICINTLVADMCTAPSVPPESES